MLPVMTCDNTRDVLPTRGAHTALVCRVFVRGQLYKMEHPHISVSN